ncbi:MAG TPA: FAD binding domain-containing protein [Candidatus Binatia bacterium]|nr:FAD binding domain-containing protein [Candidatus Binatia bacterium]
MTPFELVEPPTLREAISALDPADPSTRAIAGGTALMLMMKIGIFKPTRLVSLRRVEERYRRIDVDEDGALHIGALTPLAAVERSAAVAAKAPAITRTLLTLSNVRVRNVATVGGHLAHADPHMDLPPVLIALGARVFVVGPSSERWIDVADLFKGYYETALANDELIADLVVPPQGHRHAAYLKCTTLSADDWPAVGVAVSLETERGSIKDAVVAVSAATEKPMRLDGVAALLGGKPADEATCKRAGEAAAAALTVLPDGRGSIAYKQQLIRVYTARAIRRAFEFAIANGSAN